MVDMETVMLMEKEDWSLLLQITLLWAIQNFFKKMITLSHTNLVILHAK